MRILLIPDTQVKPGAPIDHLLWAGKYAVDRKPDVVVFIGDHWDMPSLSSYDKGKKSFEGRRYVNDINAGRQAMALFMSPLLEEQERLRRNKEKLWKPRLVFTLGNHECLDDSAEVLTHRGWVNVTEVDTSDSVLTMGATGNAEWQKPTIVFSKPYSGPMYEMQNSFMSIRCTEGHRFYTRSQAGSTIVREAKELPDDFRLNAAVHSTANGVAYSKEQLSLAAWLATDSHFAGNKVVLYQRESNAHKIRDLLVSLNVAFTEKTRDRNITHICGKELKKPCEKSVEFYMDMSVARDLSVFSNKELPFWVAVLTDEQWDVFLETLIEADGSIPTKALTSRVFYGRKQICDDVQAAAVAHGWSASITEYREGQYRVNLAKRAVRRVEDIDVIVEHYEGLVHCLVVPNGNFMMRRNGKAHITGNCRISRAVDDDPKLEGMMGYKDFGLEQWGFEVYDFLEVVVIGGVAFSHYFPSGAMQRPVTSARALLTKHHMSCVQGHVQDRDIAYGKRADGTSMTGIFAGIFYQHDEDYLGKQGNDSWRGVWMLNDVRDGAFDEMPISLNYLRRKYAGD